MTPGDPSILTYANPPPGRRFRVLAVTGLGIALVSLAVPCLIAFTLYRDRGRATFTQVGVTPTYYALPLTGVVLAILGARKRPKLLPSVAILLAVFAAASTWYICSRRW